VPPIPSSRINAHLRTISYGLFEPKTIPFISSVTSAQGTSWLTFLLIKGTYLSRVSSNKWRHECLISRHMSLICWAIFLNLFPPGLVWCRMPDKVLMGFILAPFSQLKHGSNTHLILKCGQAGTEAHCTSALPIRNSMFPEHFRSHFR
jgi:hypothetical protein